MGDRFGQRAIATGDRITKSSLDGIAAMLKRFLSTLIFGCALLASGCADAEPSKPPESNCAVSQLSAAMNDVVVTIESYEYVSCPSPYQTGYWGADSRRPRTYVSKLEMSYKGIATIIPLSAYASLAEIENVSLSEVNGDVKLRIAGGHTDSARYLSDIVFASDIELGLTLKTQRTYAVEFPDEAYEETHYSFPVGY